MKVKTSVSGELNKPNVVSMRYSDNEIKRFEDCKQYLAIPLDIPVSNIARTFSLIGLAAFERTNKKGKRK
jgi:hypothetical protein